MNGREDVDFSCTHAVDRISQLPRPILHHILSFLGIKDVVRAGIFSKTWYNTSTSFAISDFCQSLVGNPRGLFTKEDWIHIFLQFVLKSLQSQCRIYGTIPKFKLSVIPHFCHISSIQDCIQLAIQNNVKELNIDLLRDNNVRVIMPQTLLTAKELILLSLCDCHFSLPYTHDVPTWPFLRKLCLLHCHVDAQIFQYLNFSCPLLEYLCLICCNELPDISLSGLTKLTEVEIHRKSSDDLDIMVELDVPSLETFTLYIDGNWGCNVDLTACKNLTVLKWTYFSPMFSSQDLTNLIAGLPALQSLELSCDFDRIRFSSQRLEKLQLSAFQLLETDLADLIAGLPALISLCLDCTRERFMFSSQRLEKLDISTNKRMETDLTDLIAGLPALKSFSLYGKLERIKFSSQQLEELQLSVSELLEVRIDAPSLKTFECSNEVLSSDLIMGRSSPQEVTINFSYGNAFSGLKLRKFLGGFKEIKTLKLCFSGHNRLLSAELVDIPLPALPGIKHIRILSVFAWGNDGYATREDYVALLDGILWSWSCRPESLSINFENYGKFIAMVFCEELAKMVKGLHCCTDDGHIICGCRGLRSFQIKQSGGFISCDAFLESLPTLASEEKGFILCWNGNGSSQLVVVFTLNLALITTDGVVSHLVVRLNGLIY